MPLAIKSYVVVYSSFFLTGLSTNPLVWICAVPFYTALALLFLSNRELFINKGRKTW